MSKARVFAVALGLVAGSLPLSGDDRPSADLEWKIRREAVDRSQIMSTLHVLTDVYGPRLTGSPNLKQAADWAAQQMTSWGLVNARLEPWEFGHQGWLNERFTAHVVAPVKDALVGEVLAWTPSTSGVVRAAAFQIVPPERPTAESLKVYLDSVGDAVKGRAVLIGMPRRVGVIFNPPERRLDDAEARDRFDAENPTPSPFANLRPPTPVAGRLTPARVNEQIDQYLVTSGAALRINDAGRAHGQIRAFNNRTFDVTKAVPTIVLRNEDFGRISRIVADGRTVDLEVEIVNRTYPEGSTAFNTIGEIAGTDKADEVVMLGAHLDSWHAATGATDNAIGCAVVLEAARILKAVGVTPRRTIRVALWSGEEQGLLGSKAYVAAHFGTFETPKPEFEKLTGYVNIDSGTGRVRGLTVFGPAEAASVVRQAVAPLADLGVAGAIATASRRVGGTDSTSFNAAGLPGIGSTLDPIEYQSATWHTNLDTFERIVEDDVKKAATVVATTVYALAMRDEPLPRFSKDAMPKPEPPQPSPDSPPSPATARPTASAH
jgi:carboxypeptidase Q